MLGPGGGADTALEGPQGPRLGAPTLAQQEAWSLDREERRGRQKMALCSRRESARESRGSGTRCERARLAAEPREVSRPTGWPRGRPGPARAAREGPSARRPVRPGGQPPLPRQQSHRPGAQLRKAAAQPSWSPGPPSRGTPALCVLTGPTRPLGPPHQPSPLCRPTRLPTSEPGPTSARVFPGLPPGGWFAGPIYPHRWEPGASGCVSADSGPWNTPRTARCHRP